MTQRGKLIDDFLAKSRRDWRYDELTTILRAYGYIHVTSNGSHRSWKHPGDPRVLTLKDSAAGHELRCYANDVRKRIQALNWMEH